MDKGGIVLEDALDLSHLSFSGQEIINLHRKLDSVLSFQDLKFSYTKLEDLYPILDEIVNTIYYIISRTPLPMINVDVQYLLRGRPNFNDEIFKEVWQISYNTRNKEKIPLCRFNLPYETMFYAAVPSGKARVILSTAAMECFKDLIDEKNLELNNYITFGKWTLKQNIPVFNFCYTESAFNKNPELEIYSEQYINKIRSKVSPSFSEFIERFWQTCSQLACRKVDKEYQYLITTSLFWAIREYSERVLNTQTNGIIYPSSMTENEGYNIVLTPQAADKFLVPKEVFMMKFQRDKNAMKNYKVETCSNIASIVDDKFHLQLL